MSAHHDGLPSEMAVTGTTNQGIAFIFRKAAKEHRWLSQSDRKGGETFNELKTFCY